MSEQRTPRLSYAQLANIPSEYRPEIDPAGRVVRIVHLGIGAFHRAHQAFYTDVSGDWGICGVTQRSAAVVDQLAPQDGLYTLVVRGHEQTKLRLIGAVRAVVFAGADPQGVVQQMADPAVTIVSTTVTEKGYHHDPVSGALQTDDPEVAADLAGRPPRTVVGQLAAAVAARAIAHAPAFTVLCCDNVPSNGEFLGRLVQSFLERSSHPAIALDWLAANVAFPSTMVDRITPASTPADRELVARELGIDDHGAVVTEPFTQWVIENRFAGARPQWEKAGALLVPEVAPYEQLKLRVLNGSHSALAYL
ncbi:MAG: mannitol dehydrogenase family protein, partial [bacterium]